MAKEKAVVEETKEPMFSIMVAVTGDHTDEKVRFQQDNKVCFVPVNESVLVPEWVYKIFMESHWNRKHDVPEEVKTDHQK